MVAEADSNISVHLEVIARNDQHALLEPDSLRQRAGVDAMPIPCEQDGPGLWRDVRNPWRALLYPLADDRIVRRDNAARPGQNLGAARQRDATQTIADRARRD